MVLGYLSKSPMLVFKTEATFRVYAPLNIFNLWQFNIEPQKSDNDNERDTQ